MIFPTGHSNPIYNINYIVNWIKEEKCTQTFSSRIWTRVTSSISYYYNHYTTIVYVNLYRCFPLIDNISTKKLFQCYIYIYIYIYIYMGSLPGQVIPKTQNMGLDVALLYTQHVKVRIKGKVELSREWSNALPYISV